MSIADGAYWRARLTALLARHGVPGAALGIVRDGQIVDVAAGVLSRATLVPATPDAVFNLGSITKVWTTTLIMQLVDEGALTLDTPVVEVLPEFAVGDPEATRIIKVRQLVNHTSGMEDLYIETGRGDDCVERCVAALRELPQVRPVGATFSYCNSGLVVAGRIIEVVTGRTWDAVLRERLIEPLGLRATVTLPEEAILHRAAIGHPGGADAPPTRVWAGPRGLGPTGRITARVHDLLAFARMHLSGGITPDGTRVLSEASVRAMASREVGLHGRSVLGTSWGLGWARDEWDGHLVVGHNGTGIGQLAYLRLLPETGFAVGLLTNGGDGQGLYQDVFAEVFAELAGVAVPAAVEPPVEPATFDLEPYVGRYHPRADVRAEVVRRDGGLVLRTTVAGLLGERYPQTAGEQPLVPIAEGRFATRRGPSGPWEMVRFPTLPDGTRWLVSDGGLIASPRVG